ncbi:hypothetical protein [Pseudanabaena sp. FACHB-2040]|uniref:hypothetical protein n=1 Tax=Pseudanabaena sp. FACHB-2040 TaxID=2692859 RepID=UPI0016849475|nr:hypothetical protein [Pseudanabaena sp. FACHB-2040]MBD2258736.1 hypothetical protein [Pseudanabaena sp. FACHB-2040]
MEEFIPNTETYTVPPSESAPVEPIREPVRIMVTGSAIGIELIIKVLHRLGFAEPRAWSKPQLDPNSGKLVSIMTKWIRY